MAARKCCSLNVAISSLLIVGIVLLIAGCVLIPEFPKIIRKTINKGIVIKKGSEAFEEWKEPTSPFYMNYYVFDLQNETAVLSGKKATVTQKGPYAYREIRRNIPTEWADNEDSLTYLQYKAYVFDKEKSCLNCSEDDVVLTPNIPMLTLLQETLKSSKLVQFGLLSIIDVTKVTLFHKLTVKEVLFGYNDTLLMFLRNIEDNPSVKFFLKILEKVDPALAAKIPTINPFLQLQYNGTAGMNMTGTVTIRTGKDDINQIQATTAWKGNSTLQFWNSSYGNMINGTDGTHFMPNPTKTDRLYIFVTDICRSLYLNYEKETSLKDIKLLSYTTFPELFQNYSVNPENKAFCVPECYAAGLLPIGQCIPMNPPVFMSGPHFYQGAPELAEAIIGLKPDPELHRTFLDVEPYTAITMRAYKRLQVNILIESGGAYTALTKKTRKMFYPIMYIEEHGQISDADARKFKKQVYFAITISLIVQYGLIGLGGLFILSGLVVGVRSRQKGKMITKGGHNETSRLLGNGNENIYT